MDLEHFEESLRTVDDFVALAERDPATFINLALMCAGKPRTWAKAILKDALAIADERSGGEAGHNFWPDFFAAYGEQHQTEFREPCRRWPHHFELTPQSVLWLPCDTNDNLITSGICRYEAGQYHDARIAWFFSRDPRSLRGIWHKVYDNRLNLCQFYEPAGSDSEYFARLGRLIGATTDPSEYAWRLLRREWEDDDPSAPTPVQR